MEDRRVRHSKKRIRDAMIECLKSMSLDKVTVKAICDTADINRSTFYTYYTDPLQLYGIIEKELVGGFAAESVNLKANNISYIQYLKKLIHYIALNSDTYIALIGTNSASLKRENTKSISQFKVWDKGDTDTSKAYFEEFVVTGVQNVLLKWVQNGMREEEDYMAELIYKFTSNFKL